MSPDTPRTTYPAAPLARVCYVATIVLGLTAAVLGLTAPERDVLLAVLGLPMAAACAYLLVPRLRTVRAVGPNRARESASALGFAGLMLNFTGQGLGHHLEPDEPAWLFAFPVLSVVVILYACYRQYRLRGR